MREERGAADGGVAEADGDEDAVPGRLAEGRQEGRDHGVVVREAGGVAAAAAEQIGERRAGGEELEAARARALGVGDDGDGEAPQRLDLEGHERFVARDRQAREAELLAQAAHARLGGAEERRRLQRREEITEADREGLGERSGCHGRAEGSPVPGELAKLSERGPEAKARRVAGLALAAAPHHRRKGRYAWISSISSTPSPIFTSAGRRDTRSSIEGRCSPARSMRCASARRGAGRPGAQRRHRRFPRGARGDVPRSLRRGGQARGHPHRPRVPPGVGGAGALRPRAGAHPGARARQPRRRALAARRAGAPAPGHLRRQPRGPRPRARRDGWHRLRVRGGRAPRALRARERGRRVERGRPGRAQPGDPQPAPRERRRRVGSQRGHAPRDRRDERDQAHFPDGGSAQAGDEARRRGAPRPRSLVALRAQALRSHRGAPRRPARAQRALPRRGGGGAGAARRGRGARGAVAAKEGRRGRGERTAERGGAAARGGGGALP